MTTTDDIPDEERREDEASASHPPEALEDRLERFFEDRLGADPESPALRRQPRAAFPRDELARLGEYRLLREVGRGGMGVVYEAVQEPLGRRVALKVLPSGLLSDPRSLERFRREARSAGKLLHPHIVSVHGTGEREGVYFYAMQFIDGAALDSVLAEVRRLKSEGSAPALNGDPERELVTDIARSLLGGSPADAARLNPSRSPQSPQPPQTLEALRVDSPRERSPRERSPRPSSSTSSSRGRGTFFRGVARLIHQAAEALDHAHREGVLHRDVKPSNLMVDRDAKLWVTDFGLAQAQGSDALTLTGELVGTLRYLAPERLAGRADARSDVYSLGLTLYEALTLRPAFEDEDRHRLLRRIADEEPPGPRRLDPAIPLDLESIVLKATDKEPSRRYASAGELADDLARFLAGFPVRARRSGPAERLWRWSRRNPELAGLLAAVLILALALAAGGAIAALRLRRERDALAASVEETERALRQSFVSEARARRWSARPGRRFAALEALANAAAIRPSLELRNEAIAAMALVDLREEATWDLPKRGVMAVDVAATRYAFAGAEGDVAFRALPGGEELARFPGGGRKPAAMAFSADGSLAAVKYHSSPRALLRVYDLRTGTVAFESPLSRDGTPFAFGAGGRDIALAEDEMTIVVRDPASGAERGRFPTGARPLALAFHPGGELVASAGWSGTVELLRPASGEVAARLPHPAAVRSVDWDRAGKILAAGCFDWKVYLWDPASPEEPRAVLRGHDAEVTRVVFSPATDVLASTSWDNTTRLWDPRTESGLLFVDGVCGAFVRRGTALSFCSPDNRGGGLWELEPARECRFLWGHEERGKGPYHLDTSPDGRLLASVSLDGARLWELETGRELGFLPLEEPRAVFFAGDGRGLFTAGADGLRIWPLDLDAEDARTGPVPAGAGEDVARRDGLRSPLATGRAPTILGPWRNVEAAAQSGDRRRLAIALGRTGGRVLVLDPSFPAEPCAEVEGAVPSNARLELSGDGAYLVVSGWLESRVQIWSVEAGRRVAELPEPRATAAFSPCARWLVTDTGAGQRFWQVGSWNLVREVPRAVAARWGRAVAFSPDGASLAVQPTQRTIRLLDALSGAELATFEPPAALPLGSLSFSPDGAYLAAGTQRHAVLVWDLRRVRGRLREMGLDWGPGASR